MELWEILDENGEKTGKIIEKNNPKAFEKGIYHLGSDVWIINSENKILIQKRAAVKKLEPNVWAMTGGSVIAGEMSKDTIVREAKEELNIEINKEELNLIGKFKTGNVWIDTYILKKDYDIEKMKFQKEEVSDAKWVNFEEIDKLVDEEKFIKNRWNFVRELIKVENGNGNNIRQK